MGINLPIFRQFPFFCQKLCSLHKSSTQAIILIKRLCTVSGSEREQIQLAHFLQRKTTSGCSCSLSSFGGEGPKQTRGRENFVAWFKLTWNSRSNNIGSQRQANPFNWHVFFFVVAALIFQNQTTMVTFPTFCFETPNILVSENSSWKRIQGTSPSQKAEEQNHNLLLPMGVAQDRSRISAANLPTDLALRHV